MAVPSTDNGLELEEREGFAALLDANGLTEADVEGSPSRIQELQMFLQQYPKMVGLKRFPYLTTLKLIDQCIERIEGLSGCPKLRKLWLMENCISRIEGLEACTGLQELYLYSNRISSIAGLDHLAGLKVLWLADNYISSLSGLSALQQLQQLNLARNDISSIGTSLLSHTALTSLNLADNKISNFQDVANLAKLTGLQELCLADPFWGECAVAGLCNYQTFMLYLMPHLSSLDTLLLADETKAAAGATFTKKQLYYNMRIRTMRRAAAGLARQAKEGCRVLGSRWASLLSELVRAERALQQQLHQAPASEQQALQAQLSSIQAAAQSVAARQEQLATKLSADTQASAAALEDAVARLQLELSSGGNIRLEEARADEAWLASCQELLRSRLVQAGDPGGVHGISDVQVVSVARVHNRHLRLQFDRLQGSSSDSAGSDDSKRQCTDYLFYGEHPALPGDVMHVVQHGFRPCSEYSAQGLDGAMRLANCVNLADQLRMHLAIQQTNTGAGTNSAGSSSSACVLEGQLLVCKVHLGGALQEAEGKVQLSAKAGSQLLGKDGVLQTAACLDGPRVDAQQYPGASAVYRVATAAAGSSNGNSRQVLSQHRMWYMFEPAAVLPEYLVAFRYTVSAGSPLAAAAAPSSNSLLLPSTSHSNQVADSLVPTGSSSGSSMQQDPLLKLCAKPLQAWLAAAAFGQLQQQQQQQHEIGTAAAVHPQPGVAELEQRCKSLLEEASAAAPRQQLAALTPSSLSAFVGGQQLSSLTHLSLHDCGLSSCSGLLGRLPALHSLVLSFNKLTGLEDLLPHGCSVCQLTSLDVGHNQISSWQSRWLAGCCQLAVLDASHNSLTDISHLQQLTRSSPQLLQLDLTGNPVQQNKAYRLHVQSELQQLEQLDRQAVTSCSPAAAVLTPDLLRAGATQWHSQKGPVVALPAAVASAAGWQQLLHTVVLEGRGLRSLAGLATASRLVVASFADNLLTGLQGLQGCGQLLELNISNNLVTELGELSRLSSLRQLDASGNRISSLLQLTLLTGLSQLSAEGNHLTSLAGVTSMTGLLELYAAHNAVTDIKEAERLSVLPRLVILDLEGNPLVAACEDYRHLLLYRLRHLKVLDGAPATAAELAAARAKHSGRLTMSFLEEQLGSSCSLAAIRSLDVSGLRIRDVGTVFTAGTPFASLAELVLDDNTISSLAPLAGLTSLQVLKLNNNRLGEADPAGISFAVQLPVASLTIGTAAGVATPQQQQQAAQYQSLLPNLQVLHLAGNSLTSLRPLQLQWLPGLRSLFVSGNELQRLEGLEGLGQLRELAADRNKIRALEADALAPLLRLRELRLDDNLIRSLAITPAAAAAPSSPMSQSAGGGDGSGLAGLLPSLCVLQLSGNRLMDMAELDRLALLPSLLEVTLAGNPLARKQVHRPMLISRSPQLQVIDGQQVTPGERDYAEEMFALPAAEPAPADTAAGLLAAVGDNRGGWAPLTVASAASGPGCNSSNGRGTAAGKLSAVPLPAVINYKALAQAMAANSGSLAVSAAGLSAAGGLQLPGVVSSVPSIQSGVLVLSGASAFGLEGTSIGMGSGAGRNASPNGSWAGGKQRPVSGGRQKAAAGSGSPTRRVTGSARVEGSGSPGRRFAGRQVAYRGY